MDQKEFMRQMEDLVRFGRTKDNVLTREEVADYCGDMDLSGEQMELVCAYLAEQQIRIPSDKKALDLESGAVSANSSDEGLAPEDSKYLKVYRRELRGLPERSKEDVGKLFHELREGREEVVPQVIEAHLKRVVTLAGRYRGRGVPLEDLIQEGNLELVTCVTMLCGNRTVVDYGKAIDHAVRSRLIEMVDEELSDSDSVNTVLAKVNLLLEATHVLAEEYGRIATIEELSEFTRMDVEEIRMYVDLSLGSIELGTGEVRR